MFRNCKTPQKTNTDLVLVNVAQHHHNKAVRAEADGPLTVCVGKV